MTVPVDFDAASGLPISLHLMADHWHEHELLRLSNALDMGFVSGGRAPTRRRPPDGRFYTAQRC